MSQRLIKQLLYGAAYLAILAGIIYGAYALLRGEPTCFDGRKNQGEEEADCGGPCAPCEISQLRPLAVQPVTIFDAGGGRSTALLEIRNPNATFGADKITFTLNFYNATGERISSLTRESYIYASEIKFIVEPALAIPASSVTRSEVLIDEDISWKRLSEFPQPKIQIRQTRTQVDRARRQATITGEVINEETLKLPRITIGAVVSNTLGFRSGASRTVVQDVESGETRFFQIVIPLTSDEAIDVGLTKVFTEARR